MKIKNGSLSGEILILFIFITLILVLSSYNTWFPLIHNAPECIFSKDPIICTQIKIK